MEDRKKKLRRMSWRLSIHGQRGVALNEIAADLRRMIIEDGLELVVSKHNVQRMDNAVLFAVACAILPQNYFDHGVVKAKTVAYWGNLTAKATTPHRLQRHIEALKERMREIT